MIATVLESPAPTIRGCRLSKTERLGQGQMVAGVYEDWDGTTKRTWPYIDTVDHTTGDVTFTVPLVFALKPASVVFYGVAMLNIKFGADRRSDETGDLPGDGT